MYDRVETSPWPLGIRRYVYGLIISRLLEQGIQDCLQEHSMAQIGELRDDSEVALMREVVWTVVDAR